MQKTTAGTKLEQPRQEIKVIASSTSKGRFKGGSRNLEEKLQDAVNKGFEILECGGAGGAGSGDFSSINILFCVVGKER